MVLWGIKPPIFFERNDYYFTSQPYHHHCNGGGLNNFMGMYLGMGMLGQMWRNIFNPGQAYYMPRQDYYPGTQLERTIDQDIVNLKMLYPSCNFVKMEDGTYCCTTPDGKFIKSSSATELLQLVSESIAEADDNRSKVVKPSDNDDNDDTVVTPPTMDVEGWGTVKSEWFKSKFTDNNITKPTVDQIIEKLYSGDSFASIDMSTLSDSKKADLKADLIDANKDMFDNEGRPTADFDAAKLKLPLFDTYKDNYGAKTRAERDYILYMNCNNGIAKIRNPITGTYRQVRYSEGQEASAAENLRQALLSEGFKDITIKSPTSNINADKVSDNKFDKTAKYTLMFAYQASVANGTGFVYLPNGQEYKLTDLKTRHGDDRTAMIAEITRNLKNEGWTNLVIN